MKVLLLAIASAFLSLTGNSQKNFEGTITYGVSANKKNRDSAVLTAVFGKNAILLQFSDMEEQQWKSDPEQLLIRLDSGKVYMINTKKKTYRAKSMPLASATLNYEKEKMIAGHRSQSRVISEANAVFLPNYFLANTEMIFYVADDLYYTIPEKFRAVPELMVISNGKIVLGASVKFYSSRMFDEDPDNEGSASESKKAADEVVVIEAREIRAHSVAPDQLMVPMDFTKRVRSRAEIDPEAYADSVAIVADSMRIADSVAVAAIPEEPVEKKPAKSTPAKPKSKTPSKTSPARKTD